MQYLVLYHSTRWDTQTRANLVCSYGAAEQSGTAQNRQALTVYTDYMLFTCLNTVSVSVQ